MAGQWATAPEYVQIDLPQLQAWWAVLGTQNSTPVTCLDDLSEAVTEWIGMCSHFKEIFLLWLCPPSSRFVILSMCFRCVFLAFDAIGWTLCCLAGGDDFSCEQISYSRFSGAKHPDHPVETMACLAPSCIFWILSTHMFLSLSIFVAWMFHCVFPV